MRKNVCDINILLMHGVTCYMVIEYIHTGNVKEGLKHTSNDAITQSDALVLKWGKHSYSLSYQDIVLVSSGAWLNDKVRKLKSITVACFHSDCNFKVINYFMMMMNIKFSKRFEKVILSCI